MDILSYTPLAVMAIRSLAEKKKWFGRIDWHIITVPLIFPCEKIYQLQSDVNMAKPLTICVLQSFSEYIF